MTSIVPATNSPTNIRRRKIRQFKDRLAKHLIGAGGISVIIAIVLIFFYLLYVVFPLFLPGDMERTTTYDTPADRGQTVHLAVEEQNEIASRFSADGRVLFFNTENGEAISDYSLEAPGGTSFSSFSSATPGSRVVGYGLDDGSIIIAKHNYKVSYPEDNRRVITPELIYPLGEEPIVIDEFGRSLKRVALQTGEESAIVVAQTEDNRILINAMTLEESFMDDSMSVESEITTLEAAPTDVTHILLDKELRELYIADSSGQISNYDVSDPAEPELRQRLSVVASNEQITSLRFLTGDISLLIGTSGGRVSQWFPVRDKNNVQVLTKVREFDNGSAVGTIAPEYYRKGFLATDGQGTVTIYHSTAERTILSEDVSDSRLTNITFSPRANALIADDADGKTHFWKIHNEHPEVSFSSLWGKVWYESYEEPQYIWQSSSASNDFEPKMSLVPISFGTLKAAFYAMLLAMPIAIMGAIYTAYFMTPKMRSMVKPSIEIMEALPTVILGFLAGLWLAPFLEEYLPGVFALLLLMPLVIVGCSLVWFAMPRHIRAAVPEGWTAAMLILPVILTAWLAISLTGPLETLFFNGDMRSWLSNDMGIDFDQRNSLVVGLAMGFAVIPTIFSITEDAIFSVPKHLTTGSLALGATQWQTLTRVVLLTASPGIFSAVMIGLGRAVGETMIVLMATGNTPVMDFSIFQGMRTLSANIAVEMPESEVDSTHYRVLFLAALVLFMFTFFFNTIAEVVRQRLRKKYSSL